MKITTRKICIAPMLDWSDRHYRYMMRLITKHTMLYTEMITLNAILHGNKEFLLKYNPEENPVTLQLGGCVPKDFISCGKLAQELSYDEININVGCPSERVKKGNFGLSLMAEPELVADCVKAMKDNLDIPISVKCRIGYDHNDSYEQLYNFVDKQVQAGVDYLCIHARKGWLSGLSPKENRTIPELKYDVVYNIKKDFPNLELGINGSITTIEETNQHLNHVDSVMIGREAYHNPMLFKDFDNIFYNQPNTDISVLEIAYKMAEYIKVQMDNDPYIKLSNITKHTLNLFNGLANAKIYRRYLSENATKKEANVDTFLKALEVFENKL
ncbi:MULTISPECIES: tRNA dihydrouridine(20/20a) synthase DusA [Francisella]|uniref:tRNA-dihydrouridine(20/20a) synthase n=1 Tax=Francisella opportunistica TaxID=2016517 RepID=A0A345JQE7_9GAMM|nr:MULTISPECIES: tRNA dihydrouridine(20/20a) synthase DusA [Francisella]APC91245.1 tRNA dihydrouridine synthase A [Francisella sp. MA067296]AXH29543.1 tRNA dihydrouridine(20/20a) synthase DusA [Francisella opportunistica]AXH31194.1 tRNA dihydrouridine(20/20a) synthase DusA [Francisella opportunistica]AXH32841.1 tRNA dihydrouridine(20/20a) synthase DusA [Francisella opportunistica]